MGSHRHIPVIDFAECGLSVDDDKDLQQSAVMEAGTNLYRAFATSGFAYLSNSGMPSDVIESVNAITQNFYDWPLEKKMPFRGRDLTFSYDPPNHLMVNQRQGYDLSEGLRIGSTGIDDQSIVWPDVPNLKESMLKFASLSRKLVLRIFKALGTGMKLRDPEYFCKCHSLLNQKGNPTHMKAVHYFPLSDDVQPNSEIQTRIGEHTDAGSITLLFQGDIGGLQIKDSIGTFVDASPIPGTVLLNIGDELQFWSGYRLKSTVHRALCPTDPEKRKKSRRVAIYFVSADNDIPLKELEFCDRVENKPVITSGKVLTSIEYIQKRFYDIRPLPDEK